MKHILCYIALTIISFNVKSQDNLQLQFGYRGTVAAARFLPSTQLLDGYKFEFSFQYSNWVANQTITYGSLRKVHRQKALTRQDVSEIIDELDTDNQLGGGQDFMVIGVGLSTMIKKHPVIWSFSIYDRLSVNAFIPKSLVQIAWQGNKQFEGEKLDHSKTRVVGIYFREYSLGAATQLHQWTNWKLRGGLRLSYYQGLSGLINPRSHFLSRTADDAEFIELDFDFEYLYTGIEDFNFFDPRGHGFGANLGVTFSYKDILNFDLGVTDLGSINYNQQVSKVTSQDNFSFSGLGLQELIDPTAFLDSIERIFTPKIDSLGKHSFKMTIGTKLSFMTSWTFGKTGKKHGPNTLYFSYIQGFAENPGVTLRPKFSLAIHRPVLRYFNVGLSASVGGFNNYAVGALLGLHFKHFRFSIQSDDFTGFIAPNKTTGAGAGVIFQMLF